MYTHFHKFFLIIFFITLSNLVIGQNNVSSKDLVNILYQQHMISFELKNNEKKGHVFVDYVADNQYQYEIALLDRIPVNKIDSEDILKISITDPSGEKNVYQNSFDKGINDIQDFDKKINQEFSKVIQTSKAVSMKPVYSFTELKNRVYKLQQEKLN